MAPTIAECHAQGKFRNLNFGCESCPAGKVLQESSNSCIPNLAIAMCENAGKHWMPQREQCVPIPPLELALSEPLSFLEEYADSSGDLDAKGPDLNNSGKAFTLLHSFAMRVRQLPALFDKFAYLVNNTPDINAYTNSGFPNEEETALMLLAVDARWHDADEFFGQVNDSSSIAAIRYLLENRKDADVNSQNLVKQHALGFAAWDGYSQVVDELIKHGANVNLKGSGDRVPLFFATLFGDLSVVQSLLAAGADCNIASVYNGATPWTNAKVKGNSQVLAAMEANCEPEVQAAQAKVCHTEYIGTPQADGTIAVEEVEVCETEEFDPDPNADKMLSSDGSLLEPLDAQ